MKIFSNFDTKLRQRTLEEYQQEYGLDNVLCFWRSLLYKYYRVIFPLIFILLVTVLGLIFFYERLNGNYFSYIVIIFLVIDLVFIFPIFAKYFDYLMDFIIVLPNSIMMYDQWGIFKRNINTITVQSIKAINIDKSWFLYSLFDNGDILILTEWDAANKGEIKLRWIPNPEIMKEMIVKIVGIDEHIDENA